MIAVNKVQFLLAKAIKIIIYWVSDLLKSSITIRPKSIRQLLFIIKVIKFLNKDSPMKRSQQIQPELKEFNNTENMFGGKYNILKDLAANSVNTVHLIQDKKSKECFIAKMVSRKPYFYTLK